MRETVHILATCRPKTLPAALLVFRTLRTGFPTASVTVWGNDLRVDDERIVKECCAKSGCEFIGLETEVSHDSWIEQLLHAATEPFWVCDTDMVFFKSVEGFGSGLIAGRFEPAFVEPWTKTHKADRLHTSLLWFNTMLLRSAMISWIRKWHPQGFPFAPDTQFIRQCYVPQGAGKPPMFYDTCAGLYQALGGTHFTDEQNAAFEHLHCGVYADKISVALPGIQEVHTSVFIDGSNAAGLSKAQNEFYRERAICH